MSYTKYTHIGNYHLFDNSFTSIDDELCKSYDLKKLFVLLINIIRIFFFCSMFICSYCLVIFADCQRNKIPHIFICRDTQSKSARSLIYINCRYLFTYQSTLHKNRDRCRVCTSKFPSPCRQSIIHFAL